MTVSAVTSDCIQKWTKLLGLKKNAIGQLGAKPLVAKKMSA